MGKLMKCFKCGSYILKTPCKFCTTEVSCNSCLKKFVGSKFDMNCPDCTKKIKHIERNTDGVYIREVKFFHKDWSKHGIEIKAKPKDQLIHVEKEGKGERVCKFDLKEKTIKE